MNDTDQLSPAGDDSHRRWQFLRDVLVFQLKLLMDGLRDLLMSPVSIVAALVGVIVNRDEPGEYFYRALRFGKLSERWINLFGAAYSRPGQKGGSRGADEWFQRIENILVEQHGRGGMTAQAKQAIDRALDGLHQSYNVSRDGINERVTRAKERRSGAD